MQQTVKTKQNIVLSIALLASDRKDTIGKCLESLAAIRKSVPSELIILDTGCSPEVRKVLEAYADKITDFTWCNHFSEARNVTLRMAEGEWFLYLDDDEWFSDTEDLVAFFTSGEYKHYASASYVQRNYLDMQGSQFTDTRVGRMAKRTPQLEFRSKIHEYLAPISGDNKSLCARVDHYGYVYDTEEKKRAHFERNRVLLEQMIMEEPMVLRWRLQLLQEYRTMDDYARMEELGSAGIRMIRENSAGTWKEMELTLYTGSFYAAQILAYMGQEDYLHAYTLCETAKKEKYSTRLFRAFLEEMLAKALFYIGLRKQTLEEGVEFFRQSEQNAFAYLQEYAYFSANPQELYTLQVAPFVGECFDLVKIKEIYSILICDGLKLKSTDNLGKYIEKLCWNEQHVYVFEEIADILIEAMNRFAEKYKGKKFLENTEYAAYTKTLRIMHQHHALWEYFCDEIEKRQRHGLDMNGIIRLIDNVMPNEIEKGVQTSETDALVIQIKEQIQLLITNGMRDQALVAIEQIKRLIPEDEQLQELEQMCMDDIK